MILHKVFANTNSEECLYRTIPVYTATPVINEPMIRTLSFIMKTSQLDVIINTDRNFKLECFICKNSLIDEIFLRASINKHINNGKPVNICLKCKKIEFREKEFDLNQYFYRGKYIKLKCSKGEIKDVHIIFPIILINECSLLNIKLKETELELPTFFQLYFYYNNSSEKTKDFIDCIVFDKTKAYNINNGSTKVLISKISCNLIDDIYTSMINCYDQNFKCENVESCNSESKISGISDLIESIKECRILYEALKRLLSVIFFLLRKSNETTPDKRTEIDIFENEINSNQPIFYNFVEFFEFCKSCKDFISRIRPDYKTLLYPYLLEAAKLYDKSFINEYKRVCIKILDSKGKKIEQEINIIDTNFNGKNILNVTNKFKKICEFSLKTYVKVENEDVLIISLIIPENLIFITEYVYEKIITLVLFVLIEGERPKETFSDLRTIYSFLSTLKSKHTCHIFNILHEIIGARVTLAGFKETPYMNIFESVLYNISNIYEIQNFDVY